MKKTIILAIAILILVVIAVLYYPEQKTFENLEFEKGIHPEGKTGIKLDVLEDGVLTITIDGVEKISNEVVKTDYEIWVQIPAGNHKICTRVNNYKKCESVII